MVSTKSERQNKAQIFLHSLLGENMQKYSYTYKRPTTLPRSIKYAGEEWFAIRTALMKIRFNDDVPISLLFVLEDIENRYRNYLMMAKLEG